MEELNKLLVQLFEDQETPEEAGAIKSIEDHRAKVRSLIGSVIAELRKRATEHDLSKFSKEELAAFVRATPKLKGLRYGSEEYEESLGQLEPVLKHHYAVSRHHPEHYEGGISGMNLIDVMEMVCDWYASSFRQKEGDVYKSIEINQKRFGFSDDLKQIFLNTIEFLEK